MGDVRVGIAILVFGVTVLVSGLAANARRADREKSTRKGENVRNIEMRREGCKLLITVDLSQDFGGSKSGKTRIVSSSGGFIAVPSNGDGSPLFRVNLNVIK